MIKDAILFQILTMIRPGETRSARQQEFNIEKRSWTIPAERMKMRRDHVATLSDQVMEIIDRN